MWRTGLGLLVVTALLAGCASRGTTPSPASHGGAGAGHHGAMATPVAGPASPAQPYAGLQERPIKALDPQRVDDLLAGRGLGYA